MGNTVPPRMCREAGTAVVGRRRPKTVVVEPVSAAAPRRVAVAERRQRPGDVVEDEEVMTRAGRRRGEAATAVTVKIVLKRKDAKELVARLNAQSASERQARMTVIKCGLRARDGGCGGASPASCRDAWRPRLAPIQEN